jgi:hypothetical protein
MVQYDDTGLATWTSSNANVATMSATKGKVNGVAAGSVSISASDASYPDYISGCGFGQPMSCPITSGVSASASITVYTTPQITGIVPSSWTSGSTTQVTFTGQSFGSNAPTLSFSPGAGISYSLLSYSDTQIVASIAVAAGTPTEQVTVSVTNNGYGGQSFQGGSSGASATSSGVQATVSAPTISQSKPLWFFGTGVQTPGGFTFGTTSATLTVTGATTGTYLWTITNGASKAIFENNSSTITKTNANTVGISSTSYSTQANDVTVQLKLTPSGGTQITLTWSLSIDSPYKLTSAGNPADAGVAAGSTCKSFSPGTSGYLSGIPYAAISKFGQTLVSFPLNETFGSRTDSTSNNWGTPPAGGLTTDSSGKFFDCLLFAGSWNPQPLQPQNPLGNTLVYQLTQTWYFGTLTTGSGVVTQTDTINYYLDHGRHVSIVSPIGGR